MNRLCWPLGVVLLLTLSRICTAVAVAQDAALTNAGIVKLTKLEMGDAVIIAKIKAAKEVQFDTSTDELVKLREAGVSKDVIAAMIERTAEPPVRAGSGPSLRVQLQSAEGVVDLKGLYGVLRTLTSRFAFGVWAQFGDLEADIRVKERRPTILLSLDRDPREGWWLVRLTQYKKNDETYRFLNLRCLNPGCSSSAPTRGFTVPYDAIEGQPGLWRIRPLKDLSPGEYGWFVASLQWAYPYFGDGSGGILFDFGIDK